MDTTQVHGKIKLEAQYRCRTSKQSASLIRYGKDLARARIRIESSTSSAIFRVVRSSSNTPHLQQCCTIIMRWASFFSIKFNAPHEFVKVSVSQVHAEKLKVYDSEAQALQNTTDFPKVKRMKKQANQPQLQFRYNPLNDKAKDLRRHLANVLANPAVSINSWLKDSNQEMIAAMDPKFKASLILNFDLCKFNFNQMPTSFNGLKDVLFVRYEEILQKVVRITSGYKFAPSLTIDIWSDPASSYLGVTYHFFAPDGNLRRLFLGIEEVEGSKTASKVRRITEEMLKPFQLEVLDMFESSPTMVPIWCGISRDR
uniref:Transposase n=1 Tax=Ditylenchus dipsaci TaxID=166011 RepID=A0A915EB42_9BILA